MTPHASVYDIALTFIATLPATIAAISAAYSAYKSHSKTVEIARTIDGAMSARLPETKTASHAEGVLQERTDAHQPSK